MRKENIPKYQHNFRLSLECMEALEKAAKQSGKTKTRIVEEGLAWAIRKNLSESSRSVVL